MNPGPLDLSLQYLKGVGPQRAKTLQKLSLSTLRDLLFHFPRGHDDRSQRVPVSHLRPGPARGVQATVKSFTVSPLNRYLAMGEALLSDGTGFVRAVWFRRHSFRFDVFASLKKRFAPGTALIVYGPVEWGRGGLQIRVEEYELAGGEGDPTVHTGRIVPLYSLTEGLEMRWMRELLWGVVNAHAGAVHDPLPEALLKAHDLLPLPESLRGIHFPASLAERDRARRRLAFDEFFYLEAALAAARAKREDGPPATPCRSTRALLTPFRKALGYEFTAAQKRVINEIFADMGGPKPMMRLLQGDVGSGKTVVAASALLLAVENGLQGALMAPTEILAEQHHHTLKKIFAGLPVRTALFTSGVPKKEKLARLAALAAGEVDVAVGTHALLQEGVTFARLGAAVVDEQHRFGVRQRAALQAKAVSPHVLVMTATPIPRTLALTLYGDLSVSVLDQLPPGRTPIRTSLVAEGLALSAARKAVGEGRQAYIVFPLVEESEAMSLKAAVKEYERLSADVFKDLRVGLLHGRMKSDEKDAVMARFKAGDLQVLAATPVIEVGVDVPNATVMVIMDADRFGIAQLHQLRGRVGRGAHASYCFLVSQLKSPEGLERLRLLCSTTDGFRLSEEDLRLRGPGEFLGEAQHGLPAFKAGDLIHDGPLIQEARDAAFALSAEDPGLTLPSHAALKEELSRRFAAKMSLAKVG